MLSRHRVSALLVPAAVLAVVAGAAWWGGRSAAPRDAPRLPVTPATRLTALTDEAIRLYAAGQFPRACERFSRAWDEDPGSAARREDVARCFEGWGWSTLRQGRPDEAMLLFRQGLRQSPDMPALLRGLGLAAVHAGHLRAALGAEPTNATARRLLDKVEREARAEAGFQREVTPHFVVKWRAAVDADSRRALLAGLDAARERVVGSLGEAHRERVAVILYDAAQFQEVARVHGWVTGLFDGKIRLPAGGALPPRRELERILVHEYAHAVIHDLARGRAPRWLHEGLAQALEGATPDPMLRVPGRPTLGGVEELLAEADPGRARAGYDVALWVVHDLLDRGGMPAMRRLMTRLGQGEAITVAVPAVYGLSLADLEHQWRRVLGG
jgi:tetratricopeptide (TPR) repeat protein